MTTFFGGSGSPSRIATIAVFCGFALGKLPKIADAGLRSPGLFGKLSHRPFPATLSRRVAGAGAE